MAEKAAAHSDRDAEDGLLAILLDCGDTLVDEGTEVKDERQATLKAELIPGAGQAVQQLALAGYRLALVADGPVATFENVLGHFGLLRIFEARAISEEVGVEKPHARMFETALQALEIERRDYGRVVMVGNNLERDIFGANQLGLLTIWLNWGPRRRKTPLHDLEVPDFEIVSPAELPACIQQIEDARPWQKQMQE